MPGFSVGAEITTAITDLITALFILPLTFLLLSLPCPDKILKRLWIWLFLSIGIGSFIGFGAHIFAWSAKTYSIIWIFLYAVLFQILYVFLYLSIYVVFGPKHPSKREKQYVGAFALLIYLTTAILETCGINPIRIFIIYCILMALPGLFLFAVMAIRHRSRSAQILWFGFLPQLGGVVFQLLRRGAFTLIWIFDYNSIYHLCLMVSIIFFYFSARQMLRAKNIPSSVSPADNTG